MKIIFRFSCLNSIAVKLFSVNPHSFFNLKQVCEEFKMFLVNNQFTMNTKLIFFTKI